MSLEVTQDSDFVLVDVTIRDGSFEVGFDWPEQDVADVANGAVALSARVVELGYLGGVPDAHEVANPGWVMDVPADRVKSLTELLQGRASVSLIVHPAAATDLESRLGDIAEAGCGLVRVVHHPSWLERTVAAAEAVRDTGLSVAINFALFSRYNRSSFREQLDAISGSAPDIVYLADTIGSLYPTHIGQGVNMVVSEYGLSCGVHLHNRLGMAPACALAAVDAGARYIDGSLLGIGRGGGNLATEVISLLGGPTPSADACAASLGLEVAARRAGVDLEGHMRELAIAFGNLAPNEEHHLPIEPGVVSILSWLAECHHELGGDWS